MKKFLVAGIAAAAFCAAPAFAADMPTKAPVYKAATPYDPWTGSYIGLHAGYGWGRDDVLVSPGPAGFGLAPFTTHIDPKGFIGGGQIGINRRSGSLVFGVEADFSGASITGNVTDLTPVLLGGPGSFQQEHEKMNWFGTLRGRLGFTPNDNLLIYATGGLAVGHHTYSSITFFPGPTTYLAAGNSTNAGWTIGGGAEWILPGNWSAKLEYLYYDLADHTITALPVGGGGFFVNNKFDNTGNIVRFGLNYKFGSH